MSFIARDHLNLELTSKPSLPNQLGFNHGRRLQWIKRFAIEIKPYIYGGSLEVKVQEARWRIRSPQPVSLRSEARDKAHGDRSTAVPPCSSHLCASAVGLEVLLADRASLRSWTGI